MFASERYEIIIAMLQERRSVTVSELMEKFDVSIETIRRDLAFLEKRGKLTRVHGGAVAISEKAHEFSDLTARLDENAEQKRELSRFASQLVHENDIVALDVGSTTAELARILCENFKKLTVITYSRDLIDILTDNSDFDVISLGGSYYKSEHCFYGFLAEENLRRLHANVSFVAPAALSLRYGAMINTPKVFNIMKGMLDIADRKYLVADSSKFESTMSVCLCQLTDCDAIITDSALDASIARLYREKDIRIIME